jgi:archaemetzincin
MSGALWRLALRLASILALIALAACDRSAALPFSANTPAPAAASLTPPTARAVAPEGSALPVERSTPSAAAQPTSEQGVAVEASGLPRKKIYIQPLGDALPDADAELVEQSLKAFYDYDVERLERVALPKLAYYAPRARYRAEKLLDFLADQLPTDGFRILGLTGVDISTTKGPHHDWGILGLATIDDTLCIISSFRAQRGATSAEQARIRLAKTAVHEIGHTLGLPHCPRHGCLMEDGKGSVLTTDGEYDLCHECRERLLSLGHPLASSSIPIPWPKPE